MRYEDQTRRLRPLHLETQTERELFAILPYEKLHAAAAILAAQGNRMQLLRGIQILNH